MTSRKNIGGYKPIAAAVVLTGLGFFQMTFSHYQIIAPKSESSIVNIAKGAELDTPLSPFMHSIDMPADLAAPVGIAAPPLSPVFGASLADPRN